VIGAFLFANRAMSQAEIFSPGMTINSYGSTSSPVGEDVSKIIDGSVTTKFLDFNYSDGIGFTVDLGGAPSVAKSISVTTANDSPGRDPQNFEVLGSNDGTIFTSIATGSIPCSAARFNTRNFNFTNETAYSFYRVVYTVQCSLENSFQIAETQLYTSCTAPDNEAPTVVAQNITVQLDSNGQVNVSESDIITSITDNCTTNPTVQLFDTTYSCADIGKQAGWLYLSSSNSENYSQSAFYSDNSGSYMVGKNNSTNTIDLLKWNNTDWSLLSASNISVTTYDFNLVRHANGTFLISALAADYYNILVII